MRYFTELTEDEKKRIEYYLHDEDYVNVHHAILYLTEIIQRLDRELESLQESKLLEVHTRTLESFKSLVDTQRGIIDELLEKTTPPSEAKAQRDLLLDWIDEMSNHKHGVGSSTERGRLAMEFWRKMRGDS